MSKKLSKEIILTLVMAASFIVLSSVVQLSHAQMMNQDMLNVLDIHNRERALVNVMALTWNNDLAAAAQSYADYLGKLGIVCGPNGCQPPVPHGAANENIALGYVYPADFPRTSPAEYAQKWANEKVAYNAGQRVSTPSSPIGHYTAMVWKDTREVGCGFFAGAVPDEQGRGGGTDFLVCRYNPPGNSPTGGPSNLPNYCSVNPKPSSCAGTT